MSAALSATSRTRLAKLLGMLGSDHPGERATVLCIAATRDQAGIVENDLRNNESRLRAQMRPY